MYSKFLEGVTGKVAEKWVTNLLTPAFAFWMGGLLACSYHFGWETLKGMILYQHPSFQVGLLILGLILIVISATIAQSFDISMLRFLEGYWPRWMAPLRQVRSQRLFKEWEQNYKDWSKLYKKGKGNLKFHEFNDYTRLDWLITHSISEESQFMPTRLGNLLRSSEHHSIERYGLDLAACWPRLWLLLPDNARKDLQEARASLDMYVRICFWSILFLVWTPLAWWAPLITLIFTWIAYRMALNTAAVYVDLLNATFDVHRNLLYRSLRIELPSNPIEEPDAGEKLTQYLWRGSKKSITRFYDPPQ
jgi:hypothetical protein